MDLGIKGRVALVVGGSKGIGFEAAKMLADEGCPVAIVARKRADIDAAVEDVQHRGGEAMGIPADITRRADVDDAVRQVRDNFGPPLIVIGQTKPESVDG